MIIEVAFENLPTFQVSPAITIDCLLIIRLPVDFSRKTYAMKRDYRILLSLNKEATAVSEILQRYGAGGFALQGTRELAPGLKDYDHLSRILEELEG